MIPEIMKIKNRERCFVSGKLLRLYTLASVLRLYDLTSITVPT
jgi:hypothetical protein